MDLGRIIEKEAVMIELTQEQRKSLDEGKPVHVRENGQEYVLLRPDVRERWQSPASLPPTARSVSTSPPLTP
jgi:hypothetical protein